MVAMKWSTAFDNGSYKLFSLMPMDSRGDIYLKRSNIGTALA